MPVALLVLGVILVIASFGGSGSAQALPPNSGQYSLQGGSICTDGGDYRFAWADQNGAIRQGQAHDPRVVRDDRNYLEVGADRQYVLHLRADEQVGACSSNTSYNRPSGGTFIPIPFPIGGRTYNGPSSGPSSGAPSSSGKDTLSKPSQSSPPSSVGGFNFGTGSGSAAGGKSSGGTSGLSGGTGSGSAAGGKSSGGFSAPKAPSIGGGKSFGGKR